MRPEEMWELMREVHTHLYMATLKLGTIRSNLNTQLCGNGYVNYVIELLRNIIQV